MGAADEVRAFWAPKSLLSSSTGGAYEESNEVTIRNMLDVDIHVNIEEVPASRFDWKVVRSSESYVKEGNRLIFSPTIPEQSETVVKYRIQHKQPGL